jgi:membrane protease YdiL (CAAX protease family)
MYTARDQEQIRGDLGDSPNGAIDGREKAGWAASTALLGLLFAILATVLFVGFVALAFVAAGVDHPDNSPGFQFAAIAVQSVVFVTIALVMTGIPSLREFGFRPFKPSALGWALLGLVAYFALSGVYIALVHPPRDDLPQQLCADNGALLAVVTGVFVIGIAPPIEEFFFRGFLYQAFRNRIGVWGGALLSGLVFGAIHFKPEFLVPLAILGTILALLFQKTGSIWPCILVHALNNTLAFAVSL